jgi:hypothetical protein
VIAFATTTRPRDHRGGGGKLRYTLWKWRDQWETAGGGTGGSTDLIGGSVRSGGTHPTVWVPPTATQISVVVAMIVVSPTGDSTFASHQVGPGHRKDVLGTRSYGNWYPFMTLVNNTLYAIRDRDSMTTSLPPFEPHNHHLYGRPGRQVIGWYSPPTVQSSNDIEWYRSRPPSLAFDSYNNSSGLASLNTTAGLD